MRKKQNESNLIKDCLNYLNENKIPNMTLSLEKIGQGIPDYILTLKNRTIYIEFKKKGSHIQTNNQKIYQKRLEYFNQEYYLVHTLEEFKKIVDKKK